MDNSPSDLLSAASLLLAVVAVIYGLWFPEITAALAIKRKLQPADRQGDYAHVRRILFARALPLAIASVLFGAVFLPDALRISMTSWQHFQQTGWRAIYGYDAVRACLVVVSLALIALAVQVIVSAMSLWGHARKLDPKTQTK